MNVVNVVGGGRLGQEVDLNSVYEDVNSVKTEYEPETYPALIFRLEEPEATVMLFTSGKYSLAGAGSRKEAEEANQGFLSILEPLLGSFSDTNFEIRYMVCVADIDKELDLNQVVLTLGIDKIEYEPEQFPGVFYRPAEENWFAIIFSSGKVVLNGEPNVDSLNMALERIKKDLSSLIL
jgi:transcription initiation factor TFIID TATA-box-binding protein